jgi:hypothetical protein
LRAVEGRAPAGGPSSAFGHGERSPAHTLARAAQSGKHGKFIGPSGGGLVMSEREHQQERSATANLIPESVVRRIADDRRAETELAVLTDRLNDVPERRRDPGAKVNAYIDALVKRRSELLKREPPVQAVSDIRARPIESLVASLGTFFTPWITANLPYFSEGIDETPGVAGTSGSIATSGLFPGGLGFGGTPQDSGAVQPNTEKWWIHNWTCSYVFPPAPFSGWLFYRFTTDTSCLIYNAPAQSGLVNAFVTIGKTPDVLAGSPFDPGAEATVGWPFWVTLPQSTVRFFDQVPTPVWGSMQVQTGKTAAIGFIYGVIAGIASGYVQMPWGSMGTRLTLPPGASYDGEVFDKIEYRFEPDWWVKAVTQRLNA